MHHHNLAHPSENSEYEKDQMKTDDISVYSKGAEDDLTNKLAKSSLDEKDAEIVKAKERHQSG